MVFEQPHNSVLMLMALNNFSAADGSLRVDLSHEQGRYQVVKVSHVHGLVMQVPNHEIAQRLLDFLVSAAIHKTELSCHQAQHMAARPYDFTLVLPYDSAMDFLQGFQSCAQQGLVSVPLAAEQMVA